MDGHGACPKSEQERDGLSAIPFLLSGSDDGGIDSWGHEVDTNGLACVKSGSAVDFDDVATGVNHRSVESDFSDGGGVHTKKPKKVGGRKQTPGNPEDPPGGSGEFLDLGGTHKRSPERDAFGLIKGIAEGRNLDGFLESIPECVGCDRRDATAETRERGRREKDGYGENEKKKGQFFHEKPPVVDGAQL
jgi:hypothetical protein